MPSTRQMDRHRRAWSTRGRVTGADARPRLCAAVGRGSHGNGRRWPPHPFTVTDADRSASWYADLPGMQVVLEGDDDTVRFRALAHPGSGWVVGVRHYHGREVGQFDEFRTGLEHFAQLQRL